MGLQGRAQPGRADDQLTRKLITPVRIVWKSDQGKIANAERLLQPGNGQADLGNRNLCVMQSTREGNPGILLDFGKELHGGIQVVTGLWKGNQPVRVRIRLGESVSEAMSEIDTVKGATNDHAMRDFETKLPWLGRFETGNSGFRFLRIDVLDGDVTLLLKEVSAISIYRDIPYLGSFRCSDTLLNKIWQTGAYTVHQNMQEFLWDGIKRDRLVWVGDMHPEVAAIHAVFGHNGVVNKSLDLSRDITPIPGWMNGISAYSMWWILIQRDLYLYQGDKVYLAAQKTYLAKLAAHLAGKIDANGAEILDGNRFLDWPSSEDPKAVHAGLQALMVLSLSAAAELLTTLEDQAAARICTEAVTRLKKNVPPVNDSKQAAALLSLSGLIPAGEGDRVISAGGAANFSTFYGYYMLQAMAKKGNYTGALQNIREYWGGMIKLGATSFWEDFNLAWIPGAAGIDAPVPAGMKDIHGDFGAWCYKGFRHSLCHGWASGPTPWLTEHVLGIKVIAAGCSVIRIEPHLGDLAFAEGFFPTPHGLLKVKHRKLGNGKIESVIRAPKGVKIIRG
ncbi:alpha-L-rhamnosidase [Pedobacter sp. HMF7056]|uniref:Alpha-L-rhamnosidase n=2 Tax=Hufsiella ginkgonis TaxID=2695274 RepID=A0A7K1Y0M5_9SPHI|nr:alpha-L-rhamnosidase [Hufsiella ginkgonis]